MTQEKYENFPLVKKLWPGGCESNALFCRGLLVYVIMIFVFSNDLSCSVEKFCKNFRNPDPDADDLQNLTKTFLSKDPVKF